MQSLPAFGPPNRDFPDELSKYGVDLSEFGVNEIAWSRADALMLLEQLAGDPISVLGGDVLTTVAPLTYANANWSVNRQSNESFDEYAARSRLEAIEYIERYSDASAWFVLVLGDAQTYVQLMQSDS